MRLPLLSLFFLCCSLVAAYRSPARKAPRFAALPGADYGEPLFLTPYIQAGQLSEARNLSLVGPLQGTSRQSYSGYLTVKEEYNSNMFFWYFPALTDPSNAPVVVWLQGGPGSSSMFGLFAENGPFVIDSASQLQDREINWGAPFHLIYFDNPVGTGFSFTDSQQGYANDQTEVATDLYEALTQFFTLFSELQSHDFYVTGESYGGKYIPAIGSKIMTENPTAQLKINLKGVAIGDGWIDPETQNDYGDYLYNIGLIDQAQLQNFYTSQQLMVQSIQQGNFLLAESYDNTLMSMYTEYTHILDVYNYLRETEPADQNYFYGFLDQPEVRKAIHVGNNSFDDGSSPVYDHLLADICQSTKHWVEDLLNGGYKVCLYSGQVDVICAYYLTLNMIKSMQWDGQAGYAAANRTIWRVEDSDQEIAGYVRNSDNFWDILVRNAGHILPYDQARVAYDLITRFVFDKPFTN